MPHGLPVIAVLTLVLLAGCVSPGARDALPAIENDQTRPFVIALIDSGTNPYYPIFAAPEPVWRPAATLLTLNTSGPISDRIQADEALWANLVEGELYAFAGTRLLGIGFGNDWNGPPVMDASGHGAGTSYLAARDAPGAIIVMAQVPARIETDNGLASAMFADAMEWAAAQDWIDVISVSAGVPGNAPVMPLEGPDADRFLAASEAAARSGKVVVMAAGNHATPSMASYYAGAPWVIAVGGLETENHGEADLTSRVVDVVSNYSDQIPSTVEGDLDWNSGTSYAAPIVAGTLADALARVRAADPARVVATQELRDALNASAIMFNTTDWDPVPPDRNDTVGDLFLWTSVPIVTQAQMGWGYVNGSFSSEIARRILEQDFSIPPGKEQAVIVQPRYQQAREEYWARMAPR